MSIASVKMDSASRSSAVRWASVNSVRMMLFAAFLNSWRCWICGSMPSLSRAPRTNVASMPTPSIPSSPPGCSQISSNALARTKAVMDPEPSPKLSAHASAGLPCADEVPHPQAQLLHDRPWQLPADLGDEADDAVLLRGLMQRPEDGTQLRTPAHAQAGDRVVGVARDRGLGQVQLEEHIGSATGQRGESGQGRQGGEVGHASSVGARAHSRGPGESPMPSVRGTWPAGVRNLGHGRIASVGTDQRTRVWRSA